MSGGGSRSGTTTTIEKADPWVGVQPYLKDVYARAQEAADRTSTTPWSGSFIAAPDWRQQAAIGYTTGMAFRPLDLGAEVTNLGVRTARGDFLNSPYIAPALEATVRPLMDQARESIVPTIGQQAAAAGAFGDTTHQTMLARAARDTQRAIADTAAKMLESRFGEERKLQTLAPGIIQQGLSMELMPAGLLSEAGMTSRQFAQDAISDQLAQFRESLEAPWRAVMPYADVLTGLGSLGSARTGTTTGPIPTQSALAGGIQGAMAGGLGGYALGQALAMSNPWTAALVGAALLGGLGMFR